ncbi:MAG TPA: hypothetical protein PLB86_07245 [Dermatophilaceae bacterium]|nr:hypothetical protein [Dermatophilaceae bacterium]
MTVVLPAVAEWGALAILAAVLGLCLRLLVEQRKELTRLADRVRELERHDAMHERRIDAHEPWDEQARERIRQLDPAHPLPIPPPLRRERRA